jgi:hypothetical protein
LELQVLDGNAAQLFLKVFCHEASVAKIRLLLTAKKAVAIR